MGLGRRRSSTARVLSVLVLVMAVLAMAVNGASAQSGEEPDQPGVPDAATAVTYGGGDLQPLTPARLLDTREGIGAPATPVAPQSTTVLEVAGRGGVPQSGAGAVVLNVTVTEPSVDGYVTVFPSGTEAPLASNVNYAAGQTVANLVVVKLGPSGSVSLFNSSSTTHLVVDIAGWFPDASGLQPQAPVRVLDTREGHGAPPGLVAPDSTTRLQVTGAGGLPAGGVGAVVLNVTVTEPTAAGYVTASPSGIPRPVASNLNFMADQTVANLVIAKLGADGAVDLYNAHGHTHFVVDVLGWFPDTSQYVSTTPSRLLDTREAIGQPGWAPVTGGTSIPLTIEGRDGLPADGIGAVVLNVTATEPQAPGWVTAYADGVNRPLASNLNFVAGQTVPNLVVVQVGSNGGIRLYADATTHLVADVVGWFPDGGDATTTLALGAGTVLAGPGDVLATFGDSAGGGRVTLSATADLPGVGGHLAVSPHPAVPDGFFGRVVSVEPQAGGATVVELEPAPLEAGFTDIDIHQRTDVPSPGTDLSEPFARGFADDGPTAGAFMVPQSACEGSGGLSVNPSLGLELSNLQFDFDLSERHVLFRVDAVASVGFAAAFSGSFTCTFQGPPVNLPVPPAAVGFRPTFELQVSAALEAGASYTVRSTIGFEAHGGDVDNLSEVSTSQNGDLAGEVSATLSARSSFVGDLKLFGVAGFYLDLGTSVVGTIEPFAVPCIELTMQPSVGFGGSLGRWSVEWDIELATLTLPELILYQETDTCPGANARWVGDITIDQQMERRTQLIRSSDGTLSMSWTYERDFLVQISSEDTGLTNRYHDSGQSPPDLVVDHVSGQSYEKTVFYPSTDDPPCNTTTTTHDDSMWLLDVNLVDHPDTRRAVLHPEPGSTVYLRVAPYIGTEKRCADGTVVHAMNTSGGYSAGNTNEVGTPDSCFPGYVNTGGNCWMSLTVSEDGRSLQRTVTSNTTMVRESQHSPYNRMEWPITQTVTVDLRKVIDRPAAP